MRFLGFSLVAACMVVGLATPMQAEVIKDVNFSVPPTTLGFSTGGNVDPDTMVNTSTGVWDVSLAAGLGSDYALYSAPATFAANLVAGEARIAFSGGSGNIDDRTIVFMSSDNGGFAFSVAFVPGAIHGYQNNASNYSIPVSNDDGTYHTYGWTLDRVKKTLSITFDGSPVGATSYSVAGNWAGEELLYFGDATGGSAHVETWDHWNLHEVVPEPSTFVLLATGLLGLVCYAWRKRR
jgi:hypothetical protein